MGMYYARDLAVLQLKPQQMPASENLPQLACLLTSHSSRKPIYPTHRTIFYPLLASGYVSLRLPFLPD